VSGVAFPVPQSISSSVRGFVLGGAFFIDTKESSVVRYFGRAAVLSEMAKLTHSAFAGCPVEWVTFARDSRLRVIRFKSFAFTPLTAIQIPSGVDAVMGQCFGPTDGERRRLDHIEFARPVRVVSFGDGCFIQCDVHSFVVPASVEDIGREYFLEFCATAFEFQALSRLRCLGERCFQGCRIRGVCVPGGVAELAKESSRGRPSRMSPSRGAPRWTALESCVFPMRESSRFSF
jgi:hypothetical protein